MDARFVSRQEYPATHSPRIERKPVGSGSPRLLESEYDEQVEHMPSTRLPAKDGATEDEDAAAAQHDQAMSLLSTQQSDDGKAEYKIRVSETKDPLASSNGPRSFLHTIAFIFRWWYAEIIGCICAAACLAAQVAVLHSYDGKPQDSWHIEAITINGLIAILSTLCRSALLVAVAATLAQSKWNHLSRFRRTTSQGGRLGDVALFDAASRGVLGSLQVLLRFKGAHVACAGAALTIATMGLGLFAQQLITVKIDTVNVKAPGLVLRAVDVTGRNWSDFMQLGDGGGIYAPMTGLAFHAGMLSLSIADLDVVCPSTSCQWPITPTIGVCGACENVTDDIQVWAPEPDACGVSIRISNETMALGFRPCTEQAEDYVAHYFQMIGGRRTELRTDLVMRYYDPPSPGLSSYGDFAVGKFVAIGAHPDLSGPTVPPPKNPRAYHCGLWYCIQAHSITVSQGVVSDVVTETWSKGSNGTFDKLPASFNADPAENFTINGAYQIPSMKSAGYIEVVDNQISELYHEQTLYGGLVERAFDDMDSFIKKVAHSLTNDVRKNPNPFVNHTPINNTRYQGTMAADQVIYVVWWRWLTFPVAMVLLSTFYLVAEIVRTLSLSDIRPWKEDALVPLDIQLDLDLRARAVGGLDEPQGIKKRIGKVSAQYKDVDAGIRVTHIE